MPISKDVIILWPSTVASIPSNFTRETSIDGYFIKGTPNATDPGNTGGNNTHTHSSPNHTHSINSHTHTGYTTYVDPENSGNKTNTGSNEAHKGNHRHSYSIASPSASVSSEAVTYSAVSNNPPYHEFVFIKSAAEQPIPDDGIVFKADANTPGGFTFCNGDGTTPDLRNKYPRGAAAAANAGGTGGSTTNTHTITHTHTASHSHTGTSAGAGYSGNYNTSGTGTAVSNNHTHSIILASRTDTFATNSSIGSQAETVEPLHRKLNPIQNTSGVPRMPKNIIALWLGSLSSIPIGWVLCDGSNGTPDMRGYYLKCSNTTDEAGNTGGNNTHTHAAQSHSHTVTNASHSHSGSVGSHPCELGHAGGAQTVSECGNFQHTLDSCSTTTVSYASATTTANSSNNEPEHIECAFIMYVYDPSAASILLLQ